MIAGRRITLIQAQVAFVGIPLLRLRFSVVITNGLQAVSAWRTRSCVRHHIVPHGPAQPSRIAKFAKKFTEVAFLAPALPVVKM